MEFIKLPIIWTIETKGTEQLEELGVSPLNLYYEKEEGFVYLNVDDISSFNELDNTVIVRMKDKGVYTASMSIDSFVEELKFRSGVSIYDIKK